MLKSSLSPKRPVNYPGAGRLTPVSVGSQIFLGEFNLKETYALTLEDKVYMLLRFGGTGESLVLTELGTNKSLSDK